MLRLPRLGVARPTSLEQALGLLAEHGNRAMPIAGGTDLLPNLKHRLAEPELLVALDGIDELRGIRRADDGELRIGAMTTLHQLSRTPDLPAALVQAATQVASPQIRRTATLGGNVLLDTRCRYYNQSLFWRQSLGFCLKKDGTVCHVVPGGTKCVAGATNDTAPVLMTLRARLVLASASGRREVAIDDFFRADGASNKRIEPGEILTEVRVPAAGANRRGAYGKLRPRGSIDFALFGVATRIDLDAYGAVADADVVCIALGARPLRIAGVAELLSGTRPDGDDFEAAAGRVAERAFARCRPQPNLPGDADWRREMVRVLVERTLLSAARGAA